MPDETRVVAGVDEAGRGPVLGPLVVAAVRGDRGELAALGVDDSKALKPGERERLDGAVREAAEAVHVEVLDPAAIDEAVRGPGLNRLELEAFARACAAVEAQAVVADACGPDAEAFARDLARQLPGAADVQAAHGADADDPAVGAASILAKVRRDAAIAALAQELGRDVGSGYPSDPNTRAFLEAWVEEHDDLPPGTRRSWGTAQDLVRPETGLDAFAGGIPVIETMEDAVDRIEEAFWDRYESNAKLRDALEGKDRTIVIAPSDGEAHHVLVEDGEIVATGTGDRDADVRVEGSTEDILGILRGELSPLKAYFTGRVSVSAPMRDLLLVKSFL